LDFCTFFDAQARKWLWFAGKVIAIPLTENLKRALAGTVCPGG